jgi:hypothetical protein
MKCLTIVTVLLLAAPAAAQGPIARQAAAEAAALAQYGTTTTTYSTEMRSRALFWSGAALVAAGAVVSVAGLTWAQSSDLTHEFPGTRLAPCGTDPALTRLPVADCKANTGLLITGALMGGGGALMMVIGGQTVQITQVGPRAAISARVRF